MTLTFIRNLTCLELFRTPLFLREIGLIGNKGKHSHSNPIARTLMMVGFVAIAFPILVARITPMWGWGNEEQIVYSSFFLLFILFFLPAWNMDRFSSLENL